MPGYNTNLGFTIGGYDWEPANPTIDPNRPIYQTPRGNEGLLSDKAYDELSADFAGGLLGRGGYQVNQPAPTDGTYQGSYFVPNQTTGIYSASGENPDNVYNGGGNGFAGELTLRDAIKQQAMAQTPWRARNYFQDGMYYGDSVGRMLGAPDGDRTTRAQESYDRLWANYPGMTYDGLDEAYDPTKRSHVDFLQFAADDQRRKTADLMMDSGIFGHGGGDGSGN